MIRTEEQYSNSIRGNREVNVNDELGKDITTLAQFKKLGDIYVWR